MATQQGWSVATDGPEAIALRALGFLASRRRGELDRFLALHGLSAADIERHPVSSRHLTAVLDFLITNETRLLEFARAVDVPPEAAYEARRLCSRQATADGTMPWRASHGR